MTPRHQKHSLNNETNGVWYGRGAWRPFPMKTHLRCCMVLQTVMTLPSVSPDQPLKQRDSTGVLRLRCGGRKFIFICGRVFFVSEVLAVTGH